ncbi:MAG: hypothetical protein AAF694_11620 [Bacteroidota bacterium]
MFGFISDLFALESFIPKIKYFLKEKNYNQLYVYINRTAWYVDASALLTCLAMLEEHRILLNSFIWATPIVISTDSHSTDEDYTIESLFESNLSENSRRQFIPNPKYQRLMAYRKNVSLSIKTIKESLEIL